MYIDYKNLSEFLDVLDPPLQVPRWYNIFTSIVSILLLSYLFLRPNKFKIIHMDIPIVQWTDPKSGEAYEDKVKTIVQSTFLDYFALRFTALTFSMRSQKTSLQEKEEQWTKQLMWLTSR